MIGVLNINKPRGVTSSQVVVKIKKILNTKKVGHMGTLDPLASGVLPICVGKATRLFDYFLKKQKTYIAHFQFGIETTTLDLEGEIVKTSNNIPTLQEVENGVKTFLGQISQVPPNYSSKKIDGKKAYDLARKGQNLALKPCLVTIYNYQLLKQIDNNTFEFLITCSAGTYIRSLARDLGYKLNSCATMTSLLRTKTGNFCLEDAINLENITKEELEKKLIPIKTILADFEKIILKKQDFQRLLNGLPLKINVENVRDNKSDTGTNKNLPLNQESILQTNEISTETKNYAVEVENEIVGIGVVNNNFLKIKTYLIDN